MSVKFKELLEFLKNYGKTRNYKVFLVFVVISTVFWLLIKFSKQYTTRISFEANYTSIPKDMVWGEVPKNTLNIRVTASGFQQLGFALWNKKVDLDVSKIRNLGHDQYYLLPKEQLGTIVQQFPNNMELVYLSPDSIFFDLSKKIDKKIPVRLKDSLILAPSFKLLKEVTISPDSVIISGPASKVSKIEEIETEYYYKDDIRKSYTEYVKLKPLGIDKIEISNTRVDVSVSVEQFTQNTINVPIIIRNVPKGYLLKIFPDNVDVTFNTSLSSFESIKQTSFYVIADYNKIDKDNSEFIPLDIKVLNDKAEFIKVSPSEVEFLLRKIE